mmetsp:Transcript_14185/g.21646  ORF Transcript_14185/g.21646 Transcript_14185/m.21646 type:complete len:232 (+) Transcript_14185:59-754(+)
MSSMVKHSNLDQQISLVKAEILLIKQQRLDERQLYTANLASLAQRQYFYHQELSRLQHSKVSVPCAYIHVLQKQSSLDDPRYVVEKEAEVCHVLHRIEIGTKQLNLLIKQKEKVIKKLKIIKEEETKLKEETEQFLMRHIKFLGIDLAGVIVENDNKLLLQNHQLDEIKRATPVTEDVIQDVHIDNTSRLSFSNQTSSKEGNEATSRTMNIEKRIIQVGSYFGIYQTAEAA